MTPTQYINERNRLIGVSQVQELNFPCFFCFVWAKSASWPSLRRVLHDNAPVLYESTLYGRTCKCLVEKVMYRERETECGSMRCFVFSELHSKSHWDICGQIRSSPPSCSGFQPCIVSKRVLLFNMHHTSWWVYLVHPGFNHVLHMGTLLFHSEECWHTFLILITEIQ